MKTITKLLTNSDHSKQFAAEKHRRWTTKYLHDFGDYRRSRSHYWIMPVTHSQKSCTRILYKSTCTKNLTVCCAFCTSFLLHQIEQSSIRRKRLANTWPKLRDVIGWLVCWLLTIYCFVVSHCFFIVCKFLVHELASKFDASFLYKKLVQVSYTRFLTVCHQHN